MADGLTDKALEVEDGDGDGDGFFKVAADHVQHARLVVDGQQFRKHKKIYGILLRQPRPPTVFSKITRLEESGCRPRGEVLFPYKQEYIF